jgi:hypothetical protein
MNNKVNTLLSDLVHKKLFRHLPEQGPYKTEENQLLSVEKKKAPNSFTENLQRNAHMPRARLLKRDFQLGALSTNIRNKRLLIQGEKKHGRANQISKQC